MYINLGNKSKVESGNCLTDPYGPRRLAKKEKNLLILYVEDHHNLLIA